MGWFSNFVSNPIGAIGDAGQGIVDAVGDVGKSVDQTVRDVVPGGWTTAALLAAGLPPGAEGASALDAMGGDMVTGSMAGVAPTATAGYAAADGVGSSGFDTGNFVDQFLGNPVSEVTVPIEANPLAGAGPEFNGVTSAASAAPVPDQTLIDAYSNEGINQVPQAEDFIEPGSGPSGPMDPELQQAHAALDAASAPSGLEKGWNDFTKFAAANPWTTAGLGYLGLSATGALNPNTQSFNAAPYTGPLSKYRLSPNFQARHVNPQDYWYTPKRYVKGGILDVGGGNSNPQSFASGGIAHFAKGDLASTLDYYNGMIEGPASKQMAEMYTPAAGSHDLGIYRDTDPDTMYLDPVSAAQVRMAKVNKRANIQGHSMKRPTPMGQINLTPQGVTAGQQQQYQSEDMARGGILQASGHLGGYAAGGNARLLKGPGDGMSDDIPATIADKQPARLADGEFVVPADVVSHLGNGSTDAGAKKLHGMMDNVRKARTGRRAQGKQIDPNKFMPK